MIKALIILHAGPDEENPRADTAVRLAGAMLADDKEVRLFLAGQGVLLLRNMDQVSDRARHLLAELLDLGLCVECCGSSLKAQGIDTLPAGVSSSSMKALSAWISSADEVVCF